MCILGDWEYWDTGYRRLWMDKDFYAFISPCFHMQSIGLTPLFV